MGRRKFDDDATYTIAWKNDEARRSAWIYLQCKLGMSTSWDLAGMTLEERVQYLSHRLRVAYQVMTLYLECEGTYKRDGNDRPRQALGGFLSYVQELDRDALRYLTITKKRGGLEMKNKNENEANKAYTEARAAADAAWDAWLTDDSSTNYLKMTSLAARAFELSLEVTP